MQKGLIIAGAAAAVVLLAGIVYSVTRPEDPETLIGRAMEEHRIQRVRRAAEAGDAWAMNTLYLIGKSTTGKKDVRRALDLMEASDSPTARYFHFRWTHGKRERESREGKLARARFMQENLRMPFQRDEEFEKQTFIYRNSLDSLEIAATSGDPEATWIMSRL